MYIYNINNDLINKRNEKYINKTYESNFCDNFKIIGIHKKIKNKFNNWVFYYICKFDNGYEALALLSNITKGKVYNPYYPTHYNIGYMGELYSEAQRNPFYGRWKMMLCRCYNKDSEEHINYEGVEVDERWHNFTNYYNDIKYIVGYKEYQERKTKIKFHIDKDIIGNSKLYSINSCCFIPQEINIFFSKMPCNNNSGFKGVVWDKDRNKWLAQYRHKTKKILYKRFDALNDAKKAYFEIKFKCLQDYLLNDFYWLDKKIINKCNEKILQIENDYLNF